jgi:hypothetical protein
VVVRELVALFGIKTDKTSIARAESSISKFTNSVKSSFKSLAVAFGGFFAATALLRGFKDIIAAASNANEILNVLDVAFRENAENVKTWAATYSKEVGRSEFQLREMAAGLGSVLNPMLKGNIELTTEMSKRLSELAIDLGSLYEKKDEDALRAMKAALTGEIEPLRRLGVVMHEAALNEFAREQGITKTVKAMTNAEKTHLRYAFILQETAIAHGDARKTAGAYANRLKAFQAVIKDMVTRMGLRFLPVLADGLNLFIGLAKSVQGAISRFGRIVEVIARVVLWFMRLVKNMHPMMKLLVIAIPLFAKWGVVMKILLTPFMKWVAIIAAAVLVIEDLMVFVGDGESVFGKLIKKIEEFTGLPIEEDVRSILKWFGMLAKDPLKAMEVLEKGLYEFADAVVYLFTDLIPDSIRNGFISIFGNEAIPTIEWFIDQAGILFGHFWTLMTAPFKAFLSFLGDVFLGGLGTALNNVWVEISHWTDKVWNTLTKPFRKFGNFVKNLMPANVKEFLGFDVSKLKRITDVAQLPRTESFTRFQEVVQRASNNFNTDIKIDVKGTPGMDEKKLAAEVSRQVSGAMDRQNRQAMRAVTPALAGAQ